MKFTATEGAEMTATQTTYIKTRIAEAIAGRMSQGLSYEAATAEAFEYCNRRWPLLVAAITW